MIKQARSTLALNRRSSHLWHALAVIVVLSITYSSTESSPSRIPETVSTPELPTAIPTVAALAPSPTPTPFPTVPAITSGLPTLALAFEPIGDMDTAREEHSETRLDDGRVLIVGGRNQLGTVLTATLLFDPENNSLSAGGELNEPHSGHSATLLKDGRVLVAGG